MPSGRTFRIALTALGLVSALPGIAFADFAVPIPEPGTLTLLACGVAALGGLSRLRRRKK